MTTGMMQVIQARDYGEAEVLTLAQTPRPTPAAGQVRVKLHAAGVNPADWKFRRGYYQQFMPLNFPWTPGLDGAGVVDALGEGVTGWQVGQAVFGIMSASYAEYALAGEGDLAAKPEALSFAEAATIPVGGLTAWQAVALAEVQPGQRVLVQGAAGGVGLFAVQLAKRQGAHVIGTASAGNLAFVRALGADEAVDYAAGQPAAAPVDAVIDTVGGAALEAAWEWVKPGGHLVTVAGQVTPEQGAARGITAAAGRRAAPQYLADLGALAARGELKPAVGPTFPLAQAAEAHRLSETGHGRGRIILHITN